MTEQKAEQEIAPVTKSAVVRVSVEAAFRIFTEQIASWWPLETHSVGERSAETCAIEGHVGGRLYERLDDSEEVV